LNDARPLAPCFIGCGTLTHPYDMARALETLESTDFTYEVDGQILEQGEASLVKLMIDKSAATIIANGCIFLNISSFRYLDFTTENGIAVMRLHRDGTILELRGNPARDAVSESEEASGPAGRLLKETPYYGLEPFKIGEDEDEDD